MFNFFKRKELISKEEIIYNNLLYVKNLFRDANISSEKYIKYILNNHNAFSLDNLKNKYSHGSIYIGTYIEKDNSVSKNFHLFEDIPTLMSWFLENGKELNLDNGQAIFFNIPDLIFKIDNKMI